MFFVPPNVSGLFSPLISPLSSLASFLSSRGDVRRAAAGSGLGTSGCLVRLCLLCEVFSRTAAFHGLARQITPLCVCVCVCVCLRTVGMKYSKLVNSSMVCAYS